MLLMLTPWPVYAHYGSVTVNVGQRAEGPSFAGVCVFVIVYRSHRQFVDRTRSTGWHKLPLIGHADQRDLLYWIERISRYR